MVGIGPVLRKRRLPCQHRSPQRAPLPSRGSGIHGGGRSAGPVARHADPLHHRIDYPPFNYSGPDGNPAGLNVDLARMVCEELKIACTVQMRRFDTLLPSLSDNRGDAVMASIAVTPEARKLADFSDPYYRTPARFAARRDSNINDVRPERLEGALRDRGAPPARRQHLPRRRNHQSGETPGRARGVAQTRWTCCSRRISLAFWLNGTDSQNCAPFAAGRSSKAATSARVGIAVKRGNDTLRQAFNRALFRLWKRAASAICGCDSRSVLFDRDRLVDLARLTRLEAVLMKGPPGEHDVRSEPPLLPSGRQSTPGLSARKIVRAEKAAQGDLRPATAVRAAAHRHVR